MPGTTGTHNPGTTPPRTDSGVCAISPSDLVGYVGNLINRVKDLEQKVAELQTANVTANQLSDITQQVGWVTDVTYMGVDGWTQTEYGTLIPPPGFTLLGSGITLSDGNTYQAVVMDENGVLQFGVTPTGVVEGATVTGSSYLIAGATTNTLTSQRPTLAAIHSAGTGIELVDDGFTTCRVELNEVGLYSVSMNFVCLSTTGAGTSIMFVTVGDGGLGQVSFQVEDWFGRTQQTNSGLGASFLVPVYTANTTAFGIRFQSVASLAAFGACFVSVAKIAGKAT